MNGFVTVVIPHFQRDAGVLRRTVQSVLGQTGVVDYRILVVDDGSPLPAEADIKDLVHAHSQRLRIIQQKNAGPGAARNRGLEEADPGTKYVAFIDSDDQWLPWHLENAVYGLGLGYDFYFSDFYFSDYKEKTAFNRAGKIPLSEHSLIDTARQLYAYQGDMFDQILVRGNVIGTSNVVYRFEKFTNLRFREEFFNGEDYLFWLDYSREGSNFVFSSRAECDCGTGINIYAGAEWGTVRLLVRLRNELKLWKTVDKIYPLSESQRKSNKRRINSIKESIGRNILYGVRRGIVPDWALAKSMVHIDPSLLLEIPLVFGRTVIEKMDRLNKIGKRR